MEYPKLSGAARERLAAMVRRKRLKECMGIIRALEKSGMEFVVLKGPALAHYDPERGFDDLDIFVRRGDLRAAAGTLIDKFGYSFKHPEELAIMDSGRDNAHDVSLESSGMIPVELHYRMLNYLDSSILDPLPGRIYVGGMPCPDPELQLIESLLHNVYHHMMACDRGRWARDVSMIISNNGMDWEKLAGMLRAIGQSEVAYLSLRMLASHGLEVPKGAMERLAPRSAGAYLRWPVFRWVFCFARDRLFPPPHILSERFCLAGDSPFFIFTYPANWLRLALIVASSPFRRAGKRAPS
jgi:hypothetical protein